MAHEGFLGGMDMFSDYFHVLPYIVFCLVIKERGGHCLPDFVNSSQTIEKQQIKTSRLCISLPRHGCILDPFLIACECNAAPGIEDASAIAGDMIPLHGDILDTDG